MLYSIFQLYRPTQWVKNTFVFIPIFFSGQLLSNSHALLITLLVFFAFSFAASAIYCFNDIYDVEHDRLHPKKKKRPVASGKVSIPVAYFAMLIALVASITINCWIYLITDLWVSMFIIMFYFLMNIAYCIKLKHMPIVDVFVIAVGFVLRVIVGGGASGIAMSHWLILMTFLLALFLAFAKRRDDVIMYESTGYKARPNINRYSLVFMDQAIGIVASVTMVCYIMYTVSDEVVARLGTNNFYLSSVFVLAGLIRYLQITIVDKRSGSPTKVLLSDKFIHTCLVGWILCFIVILYW